jgi:hypothetical protein
MRQPAHRFRQFRDRHPFGCSKHLDRPCQLRPGPRRSRHRECLDARHGEHSSSVLRRRSQCGRLLRTQSLFGGGRRRVVVCGDGDRFRPDGREFEGKGFCVLRIAPPDGHTRLSLDLLDQASGDQLHRDFIRCAAFSFSGSVTLRSSRCAAALNMTSWVSESLMDIGIDLFVRRSPANLGLTLTRAPDRRGRGEGSSAQYQSAADVHTHALVRRERQSFLLARNAPSIKVKPLRSHGFQFGIGRFRPVRSRQSHRQNDPATWPPPNRSQALSLGQRASQNAGA